MEIMLYVSFVIRDNTMTKKTIERGFDVGYLVDMGLDAINEGMSIEEVLEWVATSAKSDEWFEGKYPNKCADKEYNGTNVIFYDIRTIGK